MFGLPDITPLSMGGFVIVAVILMIWWALIYCEVP